MAKSTYLQHCQTAARELSIGSSPSSVSGNSGIMNRLVNWVADADFEVQGLWFDWEFLRVTSWSANTVSGAAAIAAPADIGVWEKDSFWLDYSTTSNKKLYPMEYEMWRNSVRNGVNANNKPDYFIVMSDLSLKLSPTPGAIYSLTADYWKRPVKLSVNTDTSQIPEEYERIIVAGAKMKYGVDQAAGEIFNAASAEYASLLDKLESKYLRNQSGRRMSDAGMLIVRSE